MKSYGQFCPLAKGAEIFAERWTPLILRELFCGSVHFNDLRRGVPLMSPSLLSRRLKELEAAGVVSCRRGEGRSTEYRLTEAGHALWPVLDSLSAWGKRWTRSHIERHELDAGLLMWDVRRNLDPRALPRRRTVIAFEFSGTSSGKRRWWLVCEPDGVELCLLDPGFDVDLHVRTHLRTLTEVWLGDRDFRSAVERGAIALAGAPELARAFAKLFAARFTGKAPSPREPAKNRAPSPPERHA